MHGAFVPIKLPMARRQSHMQRTRATRERLHRRSTHERDLTVNGSGCSDDAARFHDGSLKEWALTEQTLMRGAHCKDSLSHRQPPLAKVLLIANARRPSQGGWRCRRSWIVVSPKWRRLYSIVKTEHLGRGALEYADLRFADRIVVKPVHPITTAVSAPVRTVPAAAITN